MTKDHVWVKCLLCDHATNNKNPNICGKCKSDIKLLTDKINKLAKVLTKKG